MTILVIGEGQAAASLARTLRAYHPVERCPTVAVGHRMLDRYPDRYSLIMSEHDGDPAEGLMRHLATMERSAPVIVIGSPGTMCSAAAPPFCTIQRTSDGCHRLKCALSHANAQPGAHPSLAQALQDQPVAFSYSAPAGPHR